MSYSLTNSKREMLFLYSSHTDITFAKATEFRCKPLTGRLEYLFSEALPSVFRCASPVFVVAVVWGLPVKRSGELCSQNKTSCYFIRSIFVLYFWRSSPTSPTISASFPSHLLLLQSFLGCFLNCLQGSWIVYSLCETHRCRKHLNGGGKL